VHRLVRRFGLLAVSALLSSGGSGQAEPPAKQDAVSDEDRAQLQALGYVDTSREIADRSVAGVIVHDAAAVQPGYRLYSAGAACEADLIDVRGTVVRNWRGKPCSKWSHAQLLPGGHLLVVGVPSAKPGSAPEPSFLLRQSWDGREVWKLPIRAHHDATYRPDGSILALALASVQNARVYPDGPVVDNPIVRITPRGTPARSTSFLTALKTHVGRCRFIDPVVPQRGAPDPLHINSILWIDRPDLAARHPIFNRTLVMLSMRHQDCIYLLDWARKKIVWDWGMGELDGPHDATLLENGNVLVFDNGMVRGWSRVLEIDIETGRIVWEYSGAADEPFYTAGRGSSQRLPNGNTLIAESGKGRAFEITKSGRIVWEFFDPRYIDDRRVAIVRMRHYDSGIIERIMSRETRELERRDSLK